MTDSSVNMKVFCPRNDKVGTVKADADGLKVEYTAAVVHTEGIFGSLKYAATDRLPDDEVGELTAYCKACNSPVILNIRDLRDAALNGAQEIHVPLASAADKKWRGAGREAMYPPEQKRMRHDPRTSTD